MHFHLDREVAACSRGLLPPLIAQGLHIYVPYSRKIWWGINFGSFAVGLESGKLKSANILPATCNDVMHAVALSLPLYVSCTCSKLGTSTLTFLVNLQTHGFVQVPQVRGRQCSLINVHQCLYEVKGPHGYWMLCLRMYTWTYRKQTISS